MSFNKWIKWIIKSSQFYRDYPDDVNKVLDLDRGIGDIIDDKVKEQISVLKQENEALKSLLSEKEPTDKEIYWNNKYPKALITYKRIETDRDYWIDVRNYFQIHDSSLPKILNDADDEMALQCLRWVMLNIKYVPDKTSYGYAEYWAYPYQTLTRKTGDCEDGAILLANMMIANGIPYWKVRLCAGDVYDDKGNSLGGHAYVTYYHEEKDRWVALDWCFYPNQDSVKDRLDYKDEIIYGKGEVWFSWNQLYCYSKSTNSGILNTKISLNT